MKGIELPINVLVIVAVAVIVLLGITAVFMLGFAPFTGTSGLESIKNDACTRLVRGGCSVPTWEITVSFDADKNGLVEPGTNWHTTGNWSENYACTETGCDNLAALCYNFYSKKSDSSCKALCGCPGYY